MKVEIIKDQKLSRKEQLIEEARRRGFTGYVKEWVWHGASLFADCVVEDSLEHFEYYEESDTLGFLYGTVYRNGEWCERISVQIIVE